MKTTTIKSVFQFRRATTEEWESVNPILRVGEPAYDITLKKHKIGDGVTAWNDLPYQEGTGTADKIDWANILNAPTKLSQFDNDLDIPDSSYIDEKLAQKADINHNHDGVYQPVGDYLTEETDPTVPEWAKQVEKPTYDYAEIKNTPNLTEYIKTEDLSPYAKTEDVDSKIKEATQGFEKYDDTEIKRRITANEESIKSLSGDGEGSVKQTVANAIAGVISGAPEDFDTLKEVADWIKNDTTGAAKMANDIAALKDSVKNPLNITGATSGQIVKIKDVGSDGAPTEWEAIDIPSGSGLAGVESINGKTGALKTSDIINTSAAPNKIAVASDGTMEVNSITVNKIVQDEEDELVIFGGNA